jgi:hypothetical protein
MTNEVSTGGSVVFKDRNAGLIAFGVLEILAGAFCALMAPLMLVGMLLPAALLEEGSAPPVDIGMMLPGLLFYVLLAVWFIWMGIGSLKARRWARALLLVSSWFWLISGSVGMIFMLFLLPDMFGQMSKTPQMPPEMVIIIMKYVMIGFMGIFYILVPGALVLFYGSKHVKATCERRDPCIRWTDKCPLPVLAVSLMFALWTPCMLFTAISGWVVPFFGVILDGAAGAVVVFLVMILYGYLSWGIYRLMIKAWWCAASLVVLWGVSTGITFSRVTLMELYEKMNYSAEQLELMKQYAVTLEPRTVLFSALWVGISLGYLLYIKKHFTHPLREPDASLEEQILNADPRI